MIFSDGLQKTHIPCDTKLTSDEINAKKLKPGKLIRSKASKQTKLMWFSKSMCYAGEN